MKLFEVQIEVTTYVVATDHRAAERIAECEIGNDRDAVGDWDIYAREITKPETHVSWDRDAIPFGDQIGDKTLAQHLDDLKPEDVEEPDPRQESLPL
jgi:hypothetical protein